MPERGERVGPGQDAARGGVQAVVREQEQAVAAVTHLLRGTAGLGGGVGLGRGRAVVRVKVKDGGWAGSRVRGRAGSRVRVRGRPGSRVRGRAGD